MEEKIQGPVTMAALAKRFGVSEEHLKEYNKWAGNGRVPAGTFTLFYIKEASLPIEPAIVKSPEEKPKKSQSASTASAKKFTDIQAGQFLSENFGKYDQSQSTQSNYSQ